MPNITNFMNRVTVQNPVTSFWRGTFQTFFKRLFRIFPESLLKPYLKKKKPSSFRKHERSIFPYKYMSRL